MRIKFLMAAVAITLPMTAQAATTVIAQSALQSGGNYYTTDLGPNIVTTGGGSASNVGGSNGRNDDGFQGPVSLGFTYTLFGTPYTSVYINNNGNISFGNGISAFVPSGPTGASAPLISPWFGDVDTRGSASGVVHYQQTTPGQLVVTWDNVGYYSSGSDKLNSFQLILRGDSFTIPVGEGQIGFFYKNMDWITTGTSQLAAVGFGDGLGNATVLDGSASEANLNNVVANKYIWFNANLTPVPPTQPVDPNPPVTGVPEPATWAMMLFGFGAVGATLRRRRNVSVRFA